MLAVLDAATTEAGMYFLEFGFGVTVASASLRRHGL